MADNTNSFTYKQYQKNKSNLNKAKFVILIGTILFGIYFYITIQNKALTGVSLVIVILMFYFALKLFQKWDKQIEQVKQKNYYTWGKGAGAELSVMKAFEELPTEFKTIIDFNTGHGNIDAIIIGPKGILTIEVKASPGIISYHNEQLYINEKLPQEGDYIKQTIAEKLWLENALRQKFNKHYPVTSLLEFTRGKIDKKSIHGPIQGIWIGGYKFHTWVMNKYPNDLSSEEIETIHSYLSTQK